MQTLCALKLKYAQVFLRQIHIIDINTTNLVLQEAYLAYILVNPCRFSYTFYKMDLLLEYQNSKFKRFYTKRSLFL